MPPVDVSAATVIGLGATVVALMVNDSLYRFRVVFRRDRKHRS